MSELKAEQWLDYAGEPRPCYPKSEADKVIAGLKEGAKNLILDNYMKDQEIKHHKYKRCLAMADMCDEVMMSCELRGYAVHRIWANRHQWAMRWKYRWLELAEKFKEEK